MKNKIKGALIDSLQIIERKDKRVAYRDVQKLVLSFLIEKRIDTNEIDIFHRLLKGDISILSENEISSSGYVVSTLEASIWSFMTTENAKDTILKAVNLGEDTDTIGSITGGISGLYYGFESFPKEWVDVIARKEAIFDLAGRMVEKVGSKK